ncbi:PQQ-dependent sugar dehydrogenase [Pseudomonadota bacterium]|nr:PQQ-dependent sugar dehydrogenase [Pseudomonadota bacterium]
MKKFRGIIYLFVLVALLLFLVFKFYQNITSYIPESIKNNVPDSIVTLHLKITDFINVSKTPDNFLYNVKFLPETNFGEFDLKLFSLTQDESNNSNDLIFNEGTASEKFFIDVFKDNIVVSTFDGNIFYFMKNRLELNKGDIRLSKIRSNLKEYPQLKILDSFIDDNNIFISTFELDEQSLKKKPYCNFSIFQANLNFEVLSFERIFFNPGCTEGVIQGGRIQKISLDQSSGLLFSLAANFSDHPTTEPQDDNSNFGKIIFLNLNTRNTEIFSKGHRNPGGLYVEDDLILSTEHGPQGGDEINKIIRNKNYGWPIVSYGSYYFAKEKKYLKNHDLNDFEEPLYSYIPSIGINEIVKIPEQFIQYDLQNTFFVSSLHGRSLHLVQFDKNYNRVIFSERIFLNRIVRDIKYIDEYNSFILSLGRKGNGEPSQLGVLIPKSNNE